MKNVTAMHNSNKIRLLLLPLAIPLWLIGWALFWIGVKASLPKRVFSLTSPNPKKTKIN